MEPSQQHRPNAPGWWARRNDLIRSTSLCTSFLYVEKDADGELIVWVKETNTIVKVIDLFPQFYYGPLHLPWDGLWGGEDHRVKVTPESRKAIPRSIFEPGVTYPTDGTGTYRDLSGKIVKMETHDGGALSITVDTELGEVRGWLRSFHPDHPPCLDYHAKVRAYRGTPLNVIIGYSKT